MAEPSERLEHENKASQVTIKNATTFRIKQIEVKSNYAIDHVKIKYDDHTEWTCGHDDGKKSNTSLIMTDGEYLVRVTHERYMNLRCAAASIEFETNKGRIFDYHPIGGKISGLMKRHNIKTVKALPGYEIYGLTIRRGTLMGTHQQLVPVTELVRHSKCWYSIITHKHKEDNPEDCIYYYEKSQALDAFTKQTAGKKGHGIILVDCISRNILKSSGEKESIIVCTKRAAELGLYSNKEEKDASITDSMKRLYRMLANKQDIATVAFITTFIFLSSCFNLEANMLTGHVLTLVTGNSTVFKTNWYTNATCKYLISCDVSKRSYGKATMLALLLLKIVENILQIIGMYVRQIICEKKNSALQRQGYEKILSLDQRYFDTHSTSEIRGNLNIETINHVACINIPHIISLSISFVATGYYLVSIHLFLGAFAVVSIILLQLFVVNPLNRAAKLAVKAEKKIVRAIHQVTNDVLTMISTVKMFSREKYHIKEIEQYEELRIESVQTKMILRCLTRFGTSMTNVVVLTITLFVCIELLPSINISTSELIGFFFLLRKFENIYQQLEWRNTMLIQEFPDIDRFVDLMEAKSSIVNGDEHLNDIKGSVEFQNVHFAYPSRPGEDVLKGFNLHIQPNKMTAIVGDSGAGKSTITKLLMRLYDPTKGTIKVDGHELPSLAIEDFHKQIGIVSQNPDLFDLPLCENIAYGIDDEYNETKMEKALMLANCDFVSKFRGGLDTFVGSLGSKLSGGQRQRIAIARAFIRNPKILILDEATSSLDAENEKMVQDALEKVMKNRTVIVIAHRLSTIKNADEIICMQDGEAVEKGTHEELMNQKNVYYKLVCRQTDEEKKLA